ncbi:ABC transporter permease [Devosia sp.]|uniref:ABC transporter permease n=1 Tax=Devosia sp. TaxID=1871048 RepID=UPI003F7296A3
MTWAYFFKRVTLFFVVVLTAMTANFIIAHSVPGDPIGAVISQMTTRGGAVENAAEIIASYRERFGLDQPLWVQYLVYVWNTLRFDLGSSIIYFPQSVTVSIVNALPWTIGLLLVATVIAFSAGSIIGAMLAWSGTPRAARLLAPLLMIFSSIPYYLLALILLYLFAVWPNWFPLGGGYASGTALGWDLRTMLTLAYHAVLPALSIVLAGLGFWALGMRGAMINVLGEDYLMLAEGEGLSKRRIFLAYGMRNALLPQITNLALSLGTIASGSVLVEVAFNYPGIGFLLYDALRASDYFMIQGICFVLVLTVALAVLVLDLIYPLIDPRIAHR